MRSALIHGTLLVVMLVYAYRTWTRDKTAAPAVGSVALWSKPEADLVSIELTSPKKIVKLERKPEGYWWGVDTTIDLKPKAKTGSAAGSGSAGSAAPPEMEEVGRKTHEFPLGDPGDTLIKSWTDAFALRDLGVPSAEAKKDYKLEDAKTTLTITFKDGPKTFLVGGSVYGGTDRYAVDQATGKAYVLSKDLVASLELGESSLHLTDPRGFDITKIGQVAITAGGRTKNLAHVDHKRDDGRTEKKWADADTSELNEAADTFISNSNNLRPTEFSTTLKASDMTPVLKLEYKTETGAPLGTLSLYRYEKPGELPPDTELDPANPPKGETQYYVISEKTHVPGLVRKDSAQKMENDIEVVFSNKPSDAAGAGSGHSAVQPKGNPFGKGPLPKIGGSGALAPKPPVPTAPKPPVPTAPGAPVAPAPAPAVPARAPSGSAH